MTQLVNITQARNNLSKLIDDIVEKNNSVILIRESTPQAVIIPYTQFKKQEQEWDDKFEEVRKQLRQKFRYYLKRKGIPYPKSETQMYDLIDKIPSRMQQ